jgi:hypothetical protein
MAWYGEQAAQPAASMVLSSIRVCAAMPDVWHLHKLLLWNRLPLQCTMADDCTGRCRCMAVCMLRCFKFCTHCYAASQAARAEGADEPG